EIADDGPGIPAEARDRLLTRGARLDESSGGHGLGLAIAADRARAYGGTLTLEASDAGGLLARVTLPGKR
ncbi:sensor histidine kinase, partial [Cereibacter changlensis JA139]